MSFLITFPDSKNVIGFVINVYEVSMLLFQTYKYHFRDVMEKPIGNSSVSN